MTHLSIEAQKCLGCKKARCQQYCPINTPIPEVIALYKEKKFIEAGKLLFENNPLSVVCAIVCPHEKQCLGHCIKGIKGEAVQFYEIEAYLSKLYLEHLQIKKPSQIKDYVAVVGGGPAGITLALILASKGYKVTLFDAHEKIGGVLRYGIPEYRLSNQVLDQYEDLLIKLGVRIRPNTLIGPVLSVDKLLEDGYKAIFIGTGVWKPKMLHIKGESLGHVHYAIDYLKSPEVYRLGEKIAIIGAGNVAMDAARTAKRKGIKNVSIFYRKGFENMPCTQAELEEAKADGVEFELFKAPLEITEEGIKYIETENAIDENGRIITVNKEGAEGFFRCDSVIIAVSQEARNNIVAHTKGLEINPWGLLVTDDYGHTTREGIFASGDVVTGAETVVRAVAHAKVVAKTMEAYMNNTQNV